MYHVMFRSHVFTRHPNFFDIGVVMLSMCHKYSNMLDLWSHPNQRNHSCVAVWKCPWGQVQHV